MTSYVLDCFMNAIWLYSKINSKLKAVTMNLCIRALQESKGI